MIRLPLLAATTVFAESVPRDPTIVPDAERPLLLTTIDWLLAALAVALVVHASVRLRRREPTILLMDAPSRTHRVREDAIVLAMAAYLLSAGLAGAWVNRAAGDGPGPAGTIMVGMVAHGGGILACLWVAGRRFDGGVKAFLFGRDRRSPDQLPGLVAILSVMAVGFPPLVHLATIVGIRVWDPTFVPPAHPTIEALHDSHARGNLVVLLWASALVTAPLAEELFFRGLVQSFLSAAARSRWRGIVWTAIAFGVVHIGQAHAVPALIFLGLVLGYAYERTGSLMLPVVVHVVFNLKTLLWDRLSGGSPS